MLSYTDQTGRELALPKLPERIISLVPSQTELLYDLGLEDEVIGITKFCVHPDHWFRSKKRIGGTKNVNISAVASLKPDLIIANKEENSKEQILLLERIAPVWVTDIKNMVEAIEMILHIGMITGKSSEAIKITTEIRSKFVDLVSWRAEHQLPSYKTAYLIWKDPYMVAGGDTFIDQMLQLSGWNNLFANKERYPTVTIEELILQKPELLLLSSEPYPFGNKHIAEFQKQLPGTKIILVDGEMFSWYGSRLLYSVDYLKKLLAGLPDNPFVYKVKPGKMFKNANNRL